MLLALSIIGIVLSAVLLLFSIKSSYSNIYLGLFYFLLSLYSFSQYVFVYSKSATLVLFLMHFAYLFYLTGPLLFLYVRSLVRDSSKLCLKDFIHLTPAIISFVFFLPFLFAPLSQKMKVASAIVDDIFFVESYRFTALSDVFSIHLLYISRPFLLLMYVIWSIGLYIHHIRKERRNLVFHRQNFMYKWLTFLLVFLLILVFSHFLLILGPVNGFLTLNILQIVSGFGMLGLLLSPFFFPEILYGLPLIIHPGSDGFYSHPEQGIQTESPKKSVDLEENYIVFLEEKITNCMNEFKPFLQPESNLVQFSVLVNIPVHHLAYYFREIKKQSFSEYRNSWRVNHAKDLIRNGSSKHLTMEAIGLASGFKTRNTFFSAFKKSEGISPGAFATNVR
jgi:AraC-like DNA-binding protein